MLLHKALFFLKILKSPVILMLLQKKDETLRQKRLDACKLEFEWLYCRNNVLLLVNNIYDAFLAEKQVELIDNSLILSIHEFYMVNVTLHIKVFGDDFVDVEPLFSHFYVTWQALFIEFHLLDFNLLVF